MTPSCLLSFFALFLTNSFTKDSTWNFTQCYRGFKRTSYYLNYTIGPGCKFLRYSRQCKCIQAVLFRGKTRKLCFSFLIFYFFSNRYILISERSLKPTGKSNWSCLNCCLVICVFAFIFKIGFQQASRKEQALGCNSPKISGPSNCWEQKTDRGLEKK